MSIERMTQALRLRFLDVARASPKKYTAILDGHSDNDGWGEACQSFAEHYVKELCEGHADKNCDPVRLACHDVGIRAEWADISEFCARPHVPTKGENDVKRSLLARRLKAAKNNAMCLRDMIRKADIEVAEIESGLAAHDRWTQALENWAGHERE